jgi:aminobenzoyl-glutamate transport protein
MLAGLTEAAARLVDPAVTVPATANYWFMAASVLLITVVGTLVTAFVVEPRLGRWTPGPEQEAAGEAPAHGPLTRGEKRGLGVAAALVVLTAVAVTLLVVPEGAVLRSPEGGLEPFYAGLVPLLALLFLVPGLGFGLAARTIRSDRDVARMTAETMSTMGAYIVLAFVAAQFVSWFGWSKLGLILAVKGAELLKASGLGGLPLLLAFVFVSGLLNLFIGSASAKWAIMAPVFVPMLMLLGFPPEATQAAYRVGDSVTNIVTPLLPYFPIVIAFAKRYDARAGLGTLMSMMVPYSLAFGAAWLAMLVAWVGFGLPFGF